MDAALAAPRIALPRVAHGTTIALAGLLLLITLVTRSGPFGDPLLHIDDQFYLLTGQALLQGDLPYVDIWDRKPIGLFLIYAGIAALGGDGVIQYQLVAGLFAFLTSLAIVATARRLTNAKGAWSAGILYLLLLPILEGHGGQSPVFYNLLMVLAAKLTIDAIQRDATLARALGAMALCGLAMLIKPTTAFEGIAIGLGQLWALWRKDRSLAPLLSRAALMVAVAIAPTAASFAAYAAIGHAGTMWDATIVSIFRKGPMAAADRFADVGRLVYALLIPLVIAIGALARQWRGATDRAPVAFVSLWLGCAVLGFASVPYFFIHYGLPLAVPLCVAAALALGDRRDGHLLFAIAAMLPIIALPRMPVEARHGNAELERLANDIVRDGRGGCLYVHSGPPHLYTMTGACRASRFVFPDHLESEVEAGALPVDTVAEAEAIFARAPTHVVTAPRLLRERNNRVAAVLERYLACRYRRQGPYQVRRLSPTTLWVLRDDAPAACPRAHAPMHIVQKTHPAISEI